MKPDASSTRRGALATAALSALLAGGTVAWSTAPVTAATSTPQLPAAIAEILRHPTLDGARFGVIATSVPDGTELFSYNAEQLFAPASVTKLFTTAAALARLQPQFIWETPIAHSGVRRDQFIDGNLWALGRGSPDLVEERLWIAARAIAETGITRVAGDMVVDDRYFDGLRYGEGWPGGDQTRDAYHAPISALMANYAARKGDDGWDAVADPATHFGERLRESLERAGVIIAGAVRRPTAAELDAIAAPAMRGTDFGASSVPGGLTHIYSIQSEPLGRLVMDINKFSNNVMAESLLKVLGATEYGAPGSATKGLAVVAKFLDEEVGIPLNSFVQADGSGLSRLDRFSPAQVSRMLLYAYSDFHIGPELVASLKIAGLDGWNPAPFKQPSLAGELRVKSGHIRGVNTLSGFVHTRAGRVLAFCAMVNGHSAGQWEIDQRMAEIADVLIQQY